MKISLILTAYKNKDLLRRCLSHYSQQRTCPHEIIIAEDADDFDLDMLLKDCRPRKLTYKLVQHEDRGFRRATILNKAISIATGDYIVSSDCDCIPHPNFIGDHHQYARESHYTVGPRAYVEERIAPEFETSLLHRIKLAAKNDLYPKKVAFRVPWLHWNSNYVSIGANFAFWKTDCIKVNGWNEAFEGWGHEDTEFMLRLRNHGIREQKRHQQCIVFHLNHPENSRDQFSANTLLLNKAREEQHRSCISGISQYFNLGHDQLISGQCQF